MIMAADRCPRCGAKLQKKILEGLCAHCLLAQHALVVRSPVGPINDFSNLARQAQVELQQQIGRGGMGIVYRCRQISLNRQAALKVLSPQFGADEQLVRRFKREAQVLAQLDHPNIIKVHDFGVFGGAPYILMDYVDGSNLRNLLRKPAMTVARTIQIALQVCDALEHAHGLGVIHRDIKPENILIEQRGRVKLADFGLATAIPGGEVTRRLTLEGQRMGTPHYMAPEQEAAPGSVDHRADVYSLGVVLYECLTGELPRGRFESPSQKNARVDVCFDRVILRALESNPEKRHQSISQLRLDLAALLEGRGVREGAVLTPAEECLFRSQLERSKARFSENPDDLRALEEMKQALLKLGLLDPVLPLCYELASRYRRRGSWAKAILILEEMRGLLPLDNPRNGELIERIRRDLEPLHPFRPDLIVKRWPDQHGLLENHSWEPKATIGGAALSEAIGLERLPETITAYQRHLEQHPEDQWARRLMVQLQYQTHQTEHETI